MEVYSEIRDEEQKSRREIEDFFIALLFAWGSSS